MIFSAQDTERLQVLFRLACLEDCAQLSAAIDREDSSAAIHHSHRLYGSALVMGAAELAERAGEMQQELSDNAAKSLVLERFTVLEEMIRRMQ